MIKMKKPPVWAAAAALAFLPAAAGAQSIGVQVNGQPVYFQGMGPEQINGRVMVPLRGVLEQMGATVRWNDATQTVTAIRGDQHIDLPIGSHTAYVNGRSMNLDVPAMVTNGTTMVPLRFVGEALGADVRWNGANQMVMIDTTQNQIDGATYTHSQVAQNYPPPVDQGYVAPRPSDRPYNQSYQPAPPARAHRTYTRTLSLPEGTVIPVKLDTPLSSDTSRSGDRFTATVEPGQDNAGLPDGTRIEGVVREATPQHGSQPGVLDLDFRRMVLPGGQSMPLTASVISLDGKSVQHSSDGRLMATGSKKNETLKWVGIGAGAGLLLGAVTKGNTLLDTLLGAGAGYLYNQVQGNKRPSDVRLGSGTEFGVRMDRQLALNVPYNADLNDNRNNNDPRFYDPNR